MSKQKNQPKSRTSKPTIGWREWIELPELNVPRIKVKVDTGARSSALHAFKLDTFESGGIRYASFFVHPEQKRRKPEIPCIAPVQGSRPIRSSNGQVEERIVICTPVKLGPYIWSIDITLTNRDEMGFRMLLGRQAIRNRFLVNPSRSFLFGSLH